MKVSKYNASGNDFVIFHSFKKAQRSELARQLCERHSGVGADGLIVLLPKGDTLEWEFYNSDGSVAGMCGNGSRAAIAYAYENGLCDKTTSLLTLSGEIKARVCDVLENGKMVVEVNLGKPKQAPRHITHLGREWILLDTGVPHMLCFVGEMGEFDLGLARQIRQEYDANVNFAHIKDGELFVRTFERGVEAETLACGTGMAACFLAANGAGLVKGSAAVYPKSGEKLEFRLENQEIYFKGEVSKSFDAILQKRDRV